MSWAPSMQNNLGLGANSKVAKFEADSNWAMKEWAYIRSRACEGTLEDSVYFSQAANKFTLGAGDSKAHWTNLYSVAVIGVQNLLQLLEEG